MYKPLTPDLRQRIIEALDEQERELNTCSENAFVNVEKIAIQQRKNLFNALPDGYPIPVEYRR